MEARSHILEILRNIVSSVGTGRAFFAGNKTPPPLMAFAVHFPRLTLLVEGTYETQLEQNREVTTLQLNPNEVVFIPPNCWDKPDMTGPSKAMHFLFGKRHTGISLVTFGSEVKAEKIALQHTLAGPEQKIIDTILELHQTRKEFTAFSHLITALLACYVTRLEDYNKPVSTRSNLLFQEICAYIQENFQHEISRSSVAQHYDISPNHLSRLFKTNGYMKFCDYVNYVRINRAKFLLQKYDLSLHQIATRCGYNDVVYFCRIFKKITKKTPKQYQNQLM
jgi:YesN/AraC family two-component response regulator